MSRLGIIVWLSTESWTWTKKVPKAQATNCTSFGWNISIILFQSTCAYVVVEGSLEVKLPTRSFHAYSICRGPPGMVRWGSAAHCECQTWQFKTLLRSFTDTAGWWFQFCLFIILPSSESNWLVVSHIGRLVVSQITRPSSDFGSWNAPWVDTSQVQWAPCSAAASAIEIEGGCWSPFSTRYLSVTSNTSKHKTALVLVFERKIPSIAPYLALQENTEMSCRRKSHMEGEWRQRGSASLAFVELWARICKSEISGPKGTSGPSQPPWKSWAWRSHNSCSHGATLHVSPAPALGKSEAGSWPVRGGRVSLVDSLLFHVTLFARDHWKYFRKAQNTPRAYSAYVIWAPRNLWLLGMSLGLRMFEGNEGLTLDATWNIRVQRVFWWT